MIHSADAPQTWRKSAFVQNHSSLAPVGLLWPKVFVGPKNLAVGPEEAPTRHDQAPEVKVETRLTLARNSMPAFGPTVET